MILIRKQYGNISKEKLIRVLTDINSSFVKDVNVKLTALSQLFNEFTSKNMTRFISSYAKSLTLTYSPESSS